MRKSTPKNQHFSCHMVKEIRSNILECKQTVENLLAFATSHLEQNPANRVATGGLTTLNRYMQSLVDLSYKGSFQSQSIATRISDIDTFAAFLFQCLYDESGMEQGIEYLCLELSQLRDNLGLLLTKAEDSALFVADMPLFRATMASYGVLEVQHA